MLIWVNSIIWQFYEPYNYYMFFAWLAFDFNLTNIGFVNQRMELQGVKQALSKIEFRKSGQWTDGMGWKFGGFMVLSFDVTWKKKPKESWLRITMNSTRIPKNLSACLEVKNTNSSNDNLHKMHPISNRKVDIFQHMLIHFSRDAGEHNFWTVFHIYLSTIYCITHKQHE